MKLLKKEKKEQYIINTDIDLEENLNINKESENKINKVSSKILNKIMERQITDYTFRDSIKSLNQKNFNVFPNQLYKKSELRRSLSGYLNIQRKSINGRKNTLILKNNQSNQNQININNNKPKVKQNYMDYEDDLYFDEDMFIQQPLSFPNEQEENFLLTLQFIEDNDYNEDIFDDNLRNNSISYKLNNRDNLHLKFFNINNDFHNKKNKKKTGCKIDNLFFDEKEIVGKNIIYLENNDEINIYSISLDLLIKKIALENFRKNYSYIFDCFMKQYKNFIPLENIINKIIQAFNYYNKKEIKVNSSELVNLLNEIILQNYDTIKQNKNLIEQIQVFYIKLKNIKFEYYKVNQDIIRIEYMLFKNLSYKENKETKKNNNGNTLIKKISSIPEKFKKSFFKKNKKVSENKEDKFIKKLKEKEKEKKHNYKYFYLNDYSNEEIAAYLTLDSYSLLSNIPEEEFYNKNCEKESIYIKKIAQRTDKLVDFIIEDITSYDHKSERVHLIERWIKIALILIDLKNYNDFVMVNCLLCNCLLKVKMKLTWQKLSKKNFEYINKLNKYRINIGKEMYKCKKKPHVPYLGVLTKQILAVQETMGYITQNNNINIFKLDKINKLITNFFKFKNYKYPFEKPKNLDILSNINPKSEDEIESTIKSLEPKLLIHANKNDKKRRTQTDISYYN